MDNSEVESTTLTHVAIEQILKKRVLRIPAPVPATTSMQMRRNGDVNKNKNKNDNDTDADTMFMQPQVFHRRRLDAIFLKCSRVGSAHNIGTMLSIMEDNQCPRVEIVCYRAEEHKERQQRILRGPHSDWKRAPLTSTTIAAADNDNDVTAINESTKMRWIDLRHFQEKKHTTSDGPFLLTEAGVVQFLRSILTPSHDASPWAVAAEPIPTREETHLSLPDIVALVLNYSSDNDDTAFSLLEKFRVSDAAPSWFLHATVFMEGLEESLIDLFHQQDNRQCSTETCCSALLIYKKLSPRQFLCGTYPALSCYDQDVDNTNNKNIENKCEMPIGQESAVVTKGCLWEETKEENEYGGGDKEKKVDGIDDNNVIESSKKTDHKNRRYRLVSPPYLDLDEEYSGANLFSKLFSKEALQIFTEDALSVPQWTPWPETAHYRVSSFCNDKPWTVFPLCHCFPANKPENFTWVPATKSFVPRTCQLLEEILRCGDGQSYLRTALFSQLAPRSVLEEHTGWADLANHVLRLHIPLIVPNHSAANDGNDDLCGTWVDGCVETHAVGRPLLFDDSKIHRAFNYSDDIRIVLIVDLARPDRLPLGTALSGHTEELDAFIQQMTTPK